MKSFGRKSAWYVRLLRIVRRTCFRSKPCSAKSFGQRVEQGGVARRVRVAEVVDRIDDPAAEDLAPEAIHFDLGEERIVLGGEPRGEVLPAIVIGRRIDFALSGKPGLHLLAGAGLRHFADS